jgi:ferredoxin
MMRGKCYEECPVGSAPITDVEISPLPTCVRCLDGCDQCSSNMSCTSCSQGYTSMLVENFNICMKNQ